MGVSRRPERSSPITETFATVSKNDFNDWNANDTISIIADLSSDDVHVLYCQGYVEMILTYMTVGICPEGSNSLSMVPSASLRTAPSASPSAAPSPAPSSIPSVIPSTQPSSSEMKVLVLGSALSSWGADVGAKIDGTGLFLQVDVTAATYLATPSFATLLQYNFVMVFSHYNFEDNAGMGNVLADYVDSGGCLSIAAIALFSPSHPAGLLGRLSSGGYLPVNTPGLHIDQVPFMTLVPVLPGHALLEGVSSFNGGQLSIHYTVSVAKGATLVVNWSNGHLLVAYKDNVCGSQLLSSLVGFF